jgi:hypothetical protein
MNHPHGNTRDLSISSFYSYEVEFIQKHDKIITDARI